MNLNEALQFLKTRPKLRITISGDIGSGKSTFGERLAKELDIPRIYIGGLMRQEAKKRGMTLDEFNHLLENDESVDKLMDKLQREQSKTLQRGIFEGRTSWFFVEEPDAKVYLAIDEKTSAQRIWNDKNNKNRDKYGSIEQVLQANRLRKQNEIKRYERYYKIDVYDKSNYDIVIDTGELSKDEAFEKTVIAIAEHIANKWTLRGARPKPHLTVF